MLGMDAHLTVAERDGLYERLDPGIRETVRILRENGIATSESCEGTPGHSYTEPTVCFEGTYAEGFHALSVCFNHGLKVTSLQRYWSTRSGEVVGPEWRLTFHHPDGGGLHSYESSDGKIRWRWGKEG